MRIIVEDHEVESYNKGNPFDVRNFGISTGLYTPDSDSYLGYYYCNQPTPDGLRRHNLSDYLLVAFNAKFELHWNKNLGLEEPKSVWCCQLAHFYLTSQLYRFPSLDDVLLYYGLEPKIDVVKLEYWDKKRLTSEVPEDILMKYMEWDVRQTYKVYLKQVEHFKQYPQLYKLFRLACQDLMVLQEMEWNGLPLNRGLCEERIIETNGKIEAINLSLNKIYPAIEINWDSPQQLSAFLYGGIIKNTERYVDGVYGPKADKAGQPRWKTREIQHSLPRMVEPLKGTALAKEGVFSTDEPTLKQIKGNKVVKQWIKLLLDRTKLATILGQYRGLPKIIDEMHWQEDILHGQLNQVVAQTGRLSATKPNQQNFNGELQDVIVSRFH